MIKLRIAVIALAAGAFCVAPAAAARPSATPIWSDPVTVAHPKGSPTGISCPSTHFCMVVDASGQAVTFDGHWRQPERIPGADTLTTVSCSSAVFCVAADWTGHTFRYAQGRWSALPRMNVRKNDGGRQISLSCPAGGRCLAVQRRSAFEFKHGRWSSGKQVLPPGRNQFVGVSCVSVRFCKAITPNGAWGYDGHRWTKEPQHRESWDGGELAVSCATRKFCATSGEPGDMPIWRGHRWRSVPTSVHVHPFPSVSCATAHFCMAVGGNRTLRWDGKRWAHSGQTGYGIPLTSVACPSADSCIAVDTVGAADQSSATGWASRRTIDRTRGGITALSCSSSDSCLAVDEYGNARHYDGHRWSAWTRADIHLASYLGGPAAQVSCVDDRLCWLVDSRGFMRRWTPNGWRSADRRPFHSGGAMTCTTRTFCISVDGTRFATFDGRHWRAPQTAKHTGFGYNSATLACASRSLCFATTGNGVARFDGTRWHRSVRLSRSFQYYDHVACQHQGMCVYLNEHNYTWTTSGDRWHERDRLDKYRTSVTVSCPRTGDCTALADAGLTYSLQGSSWSYVGRAPGSEDRYPYDISCAGRHFCMAWSETSVVATTS